MSALKHILDANFRRRFSWAARAAIVILLTAAVTWVWAHEGHAPLPSKGATPILENGVTTGVYVSREARAALGVESALVEHETVNDRVLAYATLEAPWQQHAFATSRIPGRISALHVKPGQVIAGGQVLAEVESLELENLQLEALNADNDVMLSAKTVEQTAALVKEKAIADRELREAQTKHKENLNALAIARSKWLSLSLNNEDFDRLLRERKSKLIQALPIRSPVRGVVIHADVSVGKVIEPAEHLFEIIDLSSVWVRIGVLERDLQRVQVGQTVELTLAAYPRQKFDSKIQVKGLYLDAHTHLGTVWAELKNPGWGEPSHRAENEAKFLPGMHGQAHIVIPSARKAMTVPGKALVRDGAEHYVLVEQESTVAGSRFGKETVAIVGREGDTIAVEGRSLFPGDKVVTTGSHELATFFMQGVLRLSPQTEKSIGLRVEPVQRHAVEDVTEIDGTIDLPPDRRATVSPQLSGTLEKILVERGQAVRAGDALAEVSSLESQNFQLELIRTHLQLDLIRDLISRLRELDDAQILAKRRLWEAESQFNAMFNRRESLRRKLFSVGFTEQDIQGILDSKQAIPSFSLRAPIDGVLVHFDKALGQAVKANEILFELHDLSRAWVQGHVSERDLPFVRVGQTARVRLVSNPSEVLEGKVMHSGHVIGADSRSQSVWVELTSSPKDLQHNMLARVSLTAPPPNPTLAVPLEAVAREATRNYVFVRKSDGVFERRFVEIGRNDDRYVEIRRGLQAGENVAVRGTAELQTAYAALR